MLGYSLHADPFYNIASGLQCFAGFDVAVEDMSELLLIDPFTVYIPSQDTTNCQQSIWLITLYVLSNFAVLVCMTQIMGESSGGRAMAAAIFVAFMALWAYDIYINNSRGSFVFSSNVGLCDIVAVIILLIGMEIYGRDPEPDEELITNYSLHTDFAPAATTTQQQVQETLGITSRDSQSQFKV
eukprot:gene27602-34347_t